jgi:hypothetical protein
MCAGICSVKERLDDLDFNPLVRLCATWVEPRR